MMSPATNDVLNRLLVIHNRSLANYIVDASPWLRPGEEPAFKALSLIAADLRVTVDRIAHFILDNDGEVETGDYPLHFTRYNDLSLDYLLQEMIQVQVEDIVKIERCVDALSTAPTAKALAQEAHGAALGHLDSLKELLSGEPAAAGHVAV